MKKNTKEEIIKIIEQKNNKQDKYKKELKRLKKLKEKLHTKEIEEYLKCIDDIEKLEELKSILKIETYKKCSHNIYYVKEVSIKAYTPSIILECACCNKKLLTSDVSYLINLYNNDKIISGYNAKRKIPIRPIKEYNETKENIQSKYVEICMQTIKLQEYLKENNYSNYLYLINSPEEVLASFYNEKINSKNNFKSDPIYLSSKTKRKYL